MNFPENLQKIVESSENCLKYEFYEWSTKRCTRFEYNDLIWSDFSVPLDYLLDNQAVTKLVELTT